MMKWNKVKEKIIPIFIGLLLVGLASFIVITGDEQTVVLVKRLNYLMSDVRLNNITQLRKKETTPIYIIDVDERSLNAEGRWPWSRSKMAELVKRLREYGALVIAFDIVFSEPERNPTDIIYKTFSEKKLQDKNNLGILKTNAHLFDSDEILNSVLSAEDTVLGFFMFFKNDIISGGLPSTVVEMPKNLEKNNTLLTAAGYNGNLKQLHSKNITGGFLSTIVDHDGVLRRMPLVIQYKNTLYPSIALEAVRLYLMEDAITLKMSNIGGVHMLDAIYLGKQKLPTNEFGQAVIPYLGKKGTFKYYSATDVLNKKLKPDALQNSIVFVGSSAMGLSDLKSTPVDPVFPGVEIHANLAQAILDDFIPFTPNWSKGLELVVTIFLGVILAFIFPVVKALSLFIITALSITGMVYGDFMLFAEHKMALNFAVPILLTLLLCFFNFIYGFFSETRRRREMRKTFSQYVPEEYVNAITENPKAFGLEGETKNLSVLFSDIVAFSKLSEGLSAQELKLLINEYLTPMTKIIFDNKGTIDKYVGDMIMAFWGAPLDNLEHAADSCRAALDMVSHLDELNVALSERALPEIHVGIGINTGEMNVGDMGSEFRKAYTVMGDAVNLSARLETSTRFYKVEIIVSEFTKGEAPDFTYRTLDYVKVKGKEQAVTIFELVGYKENETPDLLEELRLHEAAFKQYLAQDLLGAKQAFADLYKKHDRPMYQLYIDRITEFEENPPPADWDGAYVRTEK